MIMVGRQKKLLLGFEHLDSGPFVCLKLDGVFSKIGQRHWDCLKRKKKSHQS